MSDAQFTQQDVEVLEERAAFRGFFEVREYRLCHRLFGGGWGKIITRELFVRGSAVGVLLFDPWRDEVLLVEQFRAGALPWSRSPWMVELVAGIVERGESPEEVAQREAKEEANLTADRLEFVANYFSSPGGSDEYLHLYCGRVDLTHAGGVFGLAEEGEDIRAFTLPTAELFERLDRHEIDNAHTLIAVQWLRHHHARLCKEWRA